MKNKSHQRVRRVRAPIMHRDHGPDGPHPSWDPTTTSGGYDLSTSLVCPFVGCGYSFGHIPLWPPLWCPMGDFSDDVVCVDGTRGGR